MATVLERFEKRSTEIDSLGGVSRGDSILRDGDTLTILGITFTNGGATSPDMRMIRYHNTYNDGHNHYVSVSTWKKWGGITVK